MNVPLRLGARDPAVLQGSLAGEPVVHVDAHQGPDEVLGLLTDVVPVGRVELKLSCEIVSIRFVEGERRVVSPSPSTGLRLQNFQESQLTFEDLSKEVCIIFIVERRVTTEKDV